jgi:hypothetical protein
MPTLAGTATLWYKRHRGDGERESGGEENTYGL